MRKTSVLQLYSQSSNTLAWPDKCSKIDLCLIQWADMPPPCTFMSTLPGYFCPLPQRAWLYVLSTVLYGNRMSSLFTYAVYSETVAQGWEFAHLIFERIARFCPKMSE